MWDLIRNFLGYPRATDHAVVAPYKVEAPLPVVSTPKKCGCGRSATGLCTGLHKMSAEDWAAKNAVPAPEAAKVTKAKRVKAAPAITSTPKPKAPRKPREPKQ